MEEYAITRVVLRKFESTNALANKDRYNIS